MTGAPGVKRLWELAAREEALGEAIAGARGRMEEKHAQLDAAGVFAEYAEIHRDYVELAADPVAGMEALKRAVFLDWYELAEPACFSGLSGLDAAARRECLRALDRLCARDGLDAELAWVLPWYFLVAAYAFTAFGQLPGLAARLAALDPHAWEAADPPDDLRQRGRMGEYWQSLFDNLAAPRAIPRPADS